MSGEWFLTPIHLWSLKDFTNLVFVIPQIGMHQMGRDIAESSTTHLLLLVQYLLKRWWLYHQLRRKTCFAMEENTLLFGVEGWSNMCWRQMKEESPIASQHNWSWPYESNIRPNSSIERSKNSDKYIQQSFCSWKCLKAKSEAQIWSTLPLNAWNGHPSITSTRNSYSSHMKLLLLVVGNHSHGMKKQMLLHSYCVCKSWKKPHVFQNYL